MALTPGTRIGACEIVSPLGSGGMGDVYRARDTRLDRPVAIKALPPGFATDPERLSRFEREAKLLASLHHANIASIYGLEEVAGTPYLLLEFIEGETLAARIGRGALTARETLEIGGQIAAAMDAAHGRGIVHRDLKPGNVMITPERVVKVLDFGLARGGGADSVAPTDLSASPTVAVSHTTAGSILGTAPYMSPEQARGKPVDRRADVWAFGCVLYECLAARAAFAGETVSDVIARILEREVEWGAIPAGTPPRLIELVRRCLTKDAEERPRDIGDLRRELAAIAQEMSSPSGSGVRKAAPSLAVLYFENLANDPESEYFCTGITEDILTDLSKIKGLRVSSRNAVQRYRGAPADLAKVAAELGVDAVLEGSVRKSGDRVRITATLIGAKDGFHLWAERYDRTLADVFAVQEEIASSIAEALRVALTPAEAQALVRDRPKDAGAYDLYLRGRKKYDEYTGEAMKEALELFHQAAEVDPDYALAWAGIADCHGQMIQWGTASDTDESRRLGLEAAARAIMINPKLAEAYKARALVLGRVGEADASRAALMQAIEVNPRFVPALLNLAVDAFGRADLALAERLIRRTLEIDPQEPFAMLWLAFLCNLTGRPDAAIEVAQRLRGMARTAFYLTGAYALHAEALIRRGDLAGAAAMLEAGRAAGAGATNMDAVGSLVAVREGRIDDARRMLRELRDDTRVATGTLTLLAETALRLGQGDDARRIMERPVLISIGDTCVRLAPPIHALLDAPPFAPRRRAGALIWPLEAPMMERAVHSVYREVRIESGLPEGSELRIT
jgi:serine/threonine protein kinase/Tfp pilus assembly protein PilF